jgi:hypothetical protein
MKTTASEIKDSLGLDPDRKTSARYLALVESHRRSTGKDPGLRRSGRTTDMLCEALAKAKDGHRVSVRGHSHRYTRILRTDLLRMAGELNISSDKFVAKHEDAEFVFVDHYDPRSA